MANKNGLKKAPKAAKSTEHGLAAIKATNAHNPPALKHQSAQLAKLQASVKKHK